MWAEILIHGGYSLLYDDNFTNEINPQDMKESKIVMDKIERGYYARMIADDPGEEIYYKAKTSLPQETEIKQIRDEIKTIAEGEIIGCQEEFLFIQ